MNINKILLFFIVLVFSFFSINSISYSDEVNQSESKNEDETVTNTRPTDMNIKSQLNEERKSLSTRDREIQKVKVATTENIKELDDSFQTLKNTTRTDDLLPQRGTEAVSQTLKHNAYVSDPHFEVTQYMENDKWSYAWNPHPRDEDTN